MLFACQGGAELPSLSDFGNINLVMLNKLRHHAHF